MTRSDGWSAKRFAVIGITAQFLAPVRTLSEFFRIKYFAPAQYTLEALEPFIGAALFTAVLGSVGVTLFALGRYRTATLIALMNIGALFVYKLAFM